MRQIRIVAAIILALPLLVFGGSFLIHPFSLPSANGQIGIEMLHLIRNGGLMTPIAFSHVLAGVFLLIPRTRFLTALLQLPMSIGILVFHLTMWREGLAVALIMLSLNMVVLFDPPRLRALVEPSSN